MNPLIVMARRDCPSAFFLCGFRLKCLRVFVARRGGDSIQNTTEPQGMAASRLCLLDRSFRGNELLLIVDPGRIWRLLLATLTVSYNRQHLAVAGQRQFLSRRVNALSSILAGEAGLAH